MTVNNYCGAELIYGPARSGSVEEDVELATLSWVYWHNTSRRTTTSAISRRPSSKRRSTIHHGPTDTWSKSNNPSLWQTQGDSLGDFAGTWVVGIRSRTDARVSGPTVLFYDGECRPYDVGGSIKGGRLSCVNHFVSRPCQIR